MAEETGKRKVDHIRICLDEKAQAKKATAGFEDIQLVHRALPEIDKAKINLSTTFLGKKFTAPIIVGAMTGGTEEAIKINIVIAEAVEKLGLGMGVGSQRAAIENRTFEQTYRVAREKAPNAFLNCQHWRSPACPWLWRERSQKNCRNDRCRRRCSTSECFAGSGSA